MTSVSVIVPVELWMIFSLMSSVESLFRASIRASMDPCTSALMMTLSSLTPSFIF